MTRRGWFSLLLAALLLLTSCAPKEPTEVPSESVPPASVPVPAPEPEKRPAVEERYLDPSLYLSQETGLALEEQGVTFSVEGMSPLVNRAYTADLTFSDRSGTASFPVSVKLIPDSGIVLMEWGGISAGEDWFAVHNYYDVSIYRPGKLDQPPLTLDTSILSQKNENNVLLEVFFLPQTGWAAQMLLDGKDTFGFFREDGSLEKTLELKSGNGDTIFSNRRWVEQHGDILRYNQINDIAFIPLDEGYLLFQTGYYWRLCSKTTGEVADCDQILEQEQGGITAALYRLAPALDGGRDGLSVWAEKDEEPIYFFAAGDMKNLHPCFGWNEEFACDWSPDDHRITVFGEDTRVRLTMDFEAKKLEWEYQLCLEDLDQRFFEDPSYRSPDGRYILASAAHGGAGDVAFWLETLYDTQTGDIRIVTVSGGMYGGQEIVSFVDGDRLWVHDYGGVQLYSIDSLEPLPLPFPLELGEAYLFGLGYDQKAGQYAVLYENVTDEESGFYYSRNSTDTYRLAVYAENGTRLMDFDTDIPLQSGKGGLTRFSLVLEDGVVTFGKYDRFYDYDTSKSYTCRVLLDTQTVERQDL